jgi:uncharacterized protein
MPHFRRRSHLPYPPAHVFAWHMRPGAFRRLTPPWMQVREIEKEGEIHEGGRVILGIRKGPAELKWEAKHTAFEEGCLFRDEQVSGPFGKWVHTHRFLDADDGGCLMEDEVEWAAPLGSAGKIFGEPFIEGELERMFAFRHARLRNDLDLHARYGLGEKLTVAVSGASGLIGSALCSLLETGGHRVLRLIRKGKGEGVPWDIRRGEIDAGLLEGVDGVVHLAGESISGIRWTREKKKEILESRKAGTDLLSRAVAGMQRKPRVLISASGANFYGNRGSEILTEASGPGKGFLTEVCKAWEAATDPAARAGIRVVRLRSGMVLSPAGGALGTMLLPFKVGVGGRLGSGRQYVSWIDLDDEVGLIYHALATPGLRGPVNATAPYPVTNASFTDTLGRVLGRPTIIPLPALAVKALFGEMGEALLLEGARILPEKAEASGYPFRYPSLEDSLRFQLGRPEGG